MFWGGSPQKDKTFLRRLQVAAAPPFWLWQSKEIKDMGEYLVIDVNWKEAKLASKADPEGQMYATHYPSLT